MFRHIIYTIFFGQLVNKTADCFNNIVFILVAKFSSKKDCAVDLSRSNFRFLSGFPQKDEEEKFDDSEKLAETKFAIFGCICLTLLTFQLSNIN